jgi:hypothetical protein
MTPKRIVLGLLFAGGATAFAVSAQMDEPLRWRTGSAPIGLQLGADDWRAPCGSVVFPCDGSTSTMRLATNEQATRSLSLQVGDSFASTVLRPPRTTGLDFSFIGRADIAPALGVYGRLGTVSRSMPAWAGLPTTQRGMTYGVGLTWDFSRRASAMVGWDSYDFAGGSAGEARDIRTTRLGLQWRY